jgi:hypothetical protein
MNKLLGLFSLIAVLVIVANCRDDVFVEPPPSLTGDYHGTFTIQEGTQTPEVMDIVWRFSQNSYAMRVDTLGQNTTQISCNCAGTYVLGNNVELMETDANLDNDICREDANPLGVFSLNQSQAGRVLLIQVEGTVTKEVELFGPE